MGDCGVIPSIALPVIVQETKPSQTHSSSRARTRARSRSGEGGKEKGEAGCDAWTLARIAGHSSIAISARYVHPSEDAVMNVFTKIQRPKAMPDLTH